MPPLSLSLLFATAYQQVAFTDRKGNLSLMLAVGSGGIDSKSSHHWTQF